MAGELLAAGSRTLAKERRHLREPLHERDHVHAVAFGADDRVADTRQPHVRQHRHALGAEPVADGPHHRAHAAQGRLLLGVQRQVASEQRVRCRRTRSSLHPGDERVWLLGFRWTRRYHRAHARRIRVRPRDRRQRDQLAAPRWSSALERREAVEPVRQPRQPARHHVLQHRHAGAAGPGHRQAAEARGRHARSRMVQGDVGHARRRHAARADGRARTSRSAWRVPESVGPCARPHPARGRALAPFRRLLPELAADDGSADLHDPERARRAPPRGSHDHRLHVRPRRGGGRARASRQGAVCGS